jgi:hypothetical protein
MKHIAFHAVLVCGALVALCSALAAGEAPKPGAAVAETRVSLDDFEADPQGWKFIGGQEFPGAKGSLERDTDAAHAGKASYRLRADFSGGGAYVGCWRDLAALAVRDLKEIRLWIKSSNVAAFGVRINDASGQCHQKKAIPLAKTGEWQEVVLKVQDIVGDEHWGGANDGQWHGPATGFGLNISKGDVADAAKGTLWLDDATALVVPPGKPTILPCLLSQPACRPAYGVTVTYRWDAEPLGRDYTAFVHITSADGKTKFQDDHQPPGGTSAWSGRVEYERTIAVPTDAPLGDYKIIAGLYNPKGGARQKVKAGEGVVDAGEDACQVGVLKLTADAPLPKLGAPTLNLGGYRITFDEDFSQKDLSVSPWGPGTRWIAHTPYAGDFGDARFANPTKDFPFTIDGGILRIEAKKVGDRWQSGLLASVDPKGNGFSQKYGYFEMRAKFPGGPGTWPAFWLLGVPKLLDKSKTQIEIDVVEHYGVHPNSLHTVVHLWYPDKKHKGDAGVFIVGGMAEDFHRYGVMVEPDFITFYFDGVLLRKVKTPEEAKVPMYLLVDLALGSGWPIDKTPNPSYMYVDYVRAYAK